MGCDHLPTEPRILRACALGQVPYEAALALQERLVRARQQNACPDTLLLLEHPPVITEGRSSKGQHLRIPRAELAVRGIAHHKCGRGGDITYHGPGQLVLYPIVSLAPDRQDVRRYVWMLEEAMIRTASAFGLDAGRIQGLNGAWIDGARKVGAVGVRISRWVTMHGCALNVNLDLDAFAPIVPCGIADKGVTSLAAELGHPACMDAASRLLAEALAALLEAELQWVQTLNDT
ncbi:MAG: lipoyl(octanoyl) transferase LipB [Polyangiales bacterium]